MHNGSLVDAATNKVHQYRNDDDHAKHAAWSQRLFRLVYTSTRRWRSAFEEVCAFIYGRDEGYAGLGEGV
jgi:hypothetical protein